MNENEENRFDEQKDRGLFDSQKEKIKSNVKQQAEQKIRDSAKEFIKKGKDFRSATSGATNTATNVATNTATNAATNTATSAATNTATSAATNSCRSNSRSNNIFCIDDSSCNINSNSSNWIGCSSYVFTIFYIINC